MKLASIAAIPLEPEKRRGSPKSDPIVAPRHPPTTRKLKNWILAYQQYTANLESPDVFHMWAGLSAIAAVTVRQLYIPFQFGPVFTNIFVGFVGRPATKKTTAIETAFSLARKVVPQHMLPSAGSAAAIIASLADMKDLPTQAGNLISNELGSLIRSGDTDIINTLTDLFDCKEDQYKRTISRGKEMLAKPWLNFIFGTTPQWMGANMDSSAAEGGFFSRIVFVYCDEIKLTSPRPMMDDASNQLRAALINDLIHINSLKGEVTFSKEAGEYYDQWYLDATRLTGSTDTRTEGYLVRKSIHVLKVAMLLMLAERDDLVLKKEDIELALAILASIEKGIGTAVGSVGRNELLSHTQNILRQIHSAGRGGISYRDVLRKHVHNVKRSELDEIIGTLIQTGDVRRDRSNSNDRLYYMIQK